MVLISNLSSNAKINVAKRPNLERINYEGNIGRARISELYNMLYQHGPGNGTLLILPFDHLVGDGIGHILTSEECANSKAVIELANQGNFSALALSIGQAETYQNLIRPDLPLIIKVDGRFLSGAEVKSQGHYLISSVERAIKAGANAIGCLVSLGNENTEKSMANVSMIIDTAHQYGKPVVLWAYAHGPWPEAMGADSLFWCAQGISAAESLGADIVKQKFPVPVKREKIKAYKESLLGVREDEKLKTSFLKSKMPNIDDLLKLEPEDPDNVSYELSVRRLSFLSGVGPNILKGISGGAKGTEEDLLNTTRMIMDSGLEGQMIGRNFWSRPINEALDLNKKISLIMSEKSYHRKLVEPRFNRN